MRVKGLGYSLLIGVAVIAACYVLVIGCNAVTIYSEALFDEQLFINAGIALAQRRWLGSTMGLSSPKGRAIPSSWR